MRRVMGDERFLLLIIITKIKIAILYYFLFHLPLPNDITIYLHLTSPMVAPPLPSTLHYRRLFLVGCCVSPRRMAAV